MLWKNRTGCGVYNTNILLEDFEENGFDYSKVIHGFKDRGFIETSIDGREITRMQIQKWIKWLIMLLCRMGYEQGNF